MKTKIAYMAASIVALVVPVVGLAIPMVGCGSSSSAPPPGQDGGTGGDSTTGGDAKPPPLSDGGIPIVDATAPDGTTIVPLTATNTGYVSPTNPTVGTTVPNTVGVTGAWYAYGDSWGTEGVDGGVGVAGERGNCQLLGGWPTSTCSTITSPLPAAPQPEAGAGDATAPVADGGEAGATPPPPTGYDNGFPPTPLGSQTFCLSGIAAKVPTGDAGPDYSNVFGIGIGFDFNNMGGVKMPYNATAFHVVGIQFTISADVADGGTFPTLRVEFPTTGTNDAGGGDSYIVQPTADGIVQVLFAQQLETPFPPVSGVNIGYTAPTGDTIPMFDPSQLLSIQFHVPTNVDNSIPVNNLCVTNLSAIVSK